MNPIDLVEKYAEMDSRGLPAHFHFMERGPNPSYMKRNGELEDMITIVWREMGVSRKGLFSYCEKEGWIYEGEDF